MPGRYKDKTKTNYFDCEDACIVAVKMYVAYGGENGRL